MATLYEMEVKLKQLVAMRERSVGIDLKRTNYKIAELQGKIFHAMRSRP